MNNLLQILLGGEEVTYYLLDDGGLVHYTEGLKKAFPAKDDYDDLKLRVEALEAQLEGVTELMQENI